MRQHDPGFDPGTGCRRVRRGVIRAHEQRLRAARLEPQVVLGAQRFDESLDDRASLARTNLLDQLLANRGERRNLRPAALQDARNEPFAAHLERPEDRPDS